MAICRWKSLPKGFAEIPENSPKAGVLVSVAGTAPAKEALIANAIPQTATITRSQAQLEVKYDGDPQFKDIEGTSLQYGITPLLLSFGWMTRITTLSRMLSGSWAQAAWAVGGGNFSSS